MSTTRTVEAATIEELRAVIARLEFENTHLRAKSVRLQETVRQIEGLARAASEGRPTT